MASLAIQPSGGELVLRGAGPDFFSLDAGSANDIFTNHVDGNPYAEGLAGLLQTPQYGPANPEPSQGGMNPNGWGTLTPVIDDSTGLPFKNTKGTHAGRNQYIPLLHPELVQLVGDAVQGLSSSVKDDPGLGIDATGLHPKNGDPPNQALAGAMWARRDGVTSVDASAGQTVSMSLKQVGPQNGLWVQPT